MRPPTDLIGLLVSRGWLQEPAAREVLQEARSRGVAPVVALLEHGRVEDPVVLGVLRETLGLQEADPLDPAAVDLDALRWIHRDTAEAHLVLPLAILPRPDDPALRLAMADPLCRQSVEAVEREAGFLVEPVLAPASAIRQAIAQHYGRVRTQVIAPREPASEPKARRWVRRGGEPVTEPLHHLEDEASPAQLVQALVNLLEKKGLIDRDALAREVRALLRGEEPE